MGPTTIKGRWPFDSAGTGALGGFDSCQANGAWAQPILAEGSARGCRRVRTEILGAVGPLGP